MFTTAKMEKDMKKMKTKDISRPAGSFLNLLSFIFFSYSYFPTHAGHCSRAAPKDARANRMEKERRQIP